MIDQFGDNTPENSKTEQLNKRRSKITLFHMFLCCLIIDSGGRSCQFLGCRLLMLLTLY